MKCNNCEQTVEMCDQCGKSFGIGQDIACVMLSVGAEEHNHFCDVSCLGSWWLPEDAEVEAEEGEEDEDDEM